MGDENCCLHQRKIWTFPSPVGTIKSCLFNVFLLPGLIRERKQKVNYLYSYLSDWPVKACNWLPCAYSVCRQAKSKYYFNYLSSSLYWQPSPKSCAWEVLKSVWLLYFAVKSLIDTEYFLISNCNFFNDFRPSIAWIIVYWTLKKSVCRIFLSRKSLSKMIMYNIFRIKRIGYYQWPLTLDA